MFDVLSVVREALAPPETSTDPDTAAIEAGSEVAAVATTNTTSAVARSRRS